MKETKKLYLMETQKDICSPQTVLSFGTEQYTVSLIKGVICYNFYDIIV